MYNQIILMGRMLFRRFTTGRPSGNGLRRKDKNYGS